MVSPIDLLLLVASSLLVINAPVAVALSFKYTKFDAGAVAPTCSSKQVRRICLQGDATVDRDGAIQLTTAQSSSTGRVSYTQPLHLWDKATGAATDFTTSFSFAITNNNTNIADGMAFFLSRYPSQIPVSSAGGYLGLVSSFNAFNASGDLSFVAVEFDSFMNVWDTSSSHVGVDINSVQSVADENLVGEGFTAFATGNSQVRYFSKTQRLRVSLNYNGKRYALSYAVDLKRVLPEWVSLGFSAATGSLAEFNKILSWSFKSTL